MTADTADIIIGEAPEAGRIRTLLSPTAEDMGFDIVRVRFLGGEGRRTLQVMAERPDGTMDVGGCMELSRAFSALLDVEDPISAAYDLEVSSPGIDRPLTRIKDFERWVGHEAKLEMAAPIDGRRRFRGKLEGIGGEEILLRTQVEARSEPQVLGFAFGLLSDAKLVMTNDLIRQDLHANPQGDDEAEVTLDKTKLN